MPAAVAHNALHNDGGDEMRGIQGGWLLSTRKVRESRNMRMKGWIQAHPFQARSLSWHVSVCDSLLQQQGPEMGCDGGMVPWNFQMLRLGFFT